MRGLLITLFPVFIFLSLSAQQQTATVSGTVRDSSGHSLSSATVAAVGTSSGVYTDNNGKFEFTVPAGQKVKIVFSYLGLESDSISLTLKAGEKREINM